MKNKERKTQGLTVGIETWQQFKHYCRENNAKMGGLCDWIIREWLAKQAPSPLRNEAQVGHRTESGRDY